MEVRNKYQQKLVPLDEGERRAKETRLTEGCTTLMYACSQGLTSKIVNELRNKVSAFNILLQTCICRNSFEY